MRNLTWEEDVLPNLEWLVRWAESHTPEVFDAKELVEAARKELDETKTYERSRIFG